MAGQCTSKMEGNVAVFQPYPPMARLRWKEHEERDGVDEGRGSGEEEAERERRRERERVKSWWGGVAQALGTWRLWWLLFVCCCRCCS